MPEGNNDLNNNRNLPNVDSLHKKGENNNSNFSNNSKSTGNTTGINSVKPQSNIAGDLKQKAIKGVANKIAPGIGGKVVDAASKLKNNPTAKKNNTGKNILKNNTGISVPSSSALTKEKEKNQGKLQQQIKKNAIRAVANAFAPGVGGKAVDTLSKINDKKKGATGKKETDDSNSDESKTKTNSDISLLGNISKPTLIKIMIPIICSCVLFLFIIVIAVESINKFTDLIGVGSSGVAADIKGASGGDKELEDLYNRIINVQVEYSNNGKKFSADLIAAVYHVVSSRANGYKISDMSDSVIRELADAMFDESCSDNNCTYNYSESNFRDYLTNTFFPKYLSSGESSNATDEVFEYLQQYRDLVGYSESDFYLCSDISLTNTNLSRSQFIDYVTKFYSSKKTTKVLADNAGKIYDISIQNNFNPEMVIIRANSEGHDPGGNTNNYWGIGCTNSGGAKACSSYKTLDEGVLAYIKIAAKSDTLLNMFYKNHYAYIGSYWDPSFSSSSKGGCYYYPYIKKYMSNDRSSTVNNSCSSSCKGAACLSTNDEDQLAYSKFQIENSLKFRSDIFGISSTDCSESNSSTTSGGDGLNVVNYAVQTFDSYLYSQKLRMSDGYVDCSSMVARAYNHFNIKIYDSSNTSGEIYRWCESNNKLISSGDLQPGDLIFYNTGTYNNAKNYKNIGHVAMYYVNGQTFAAHTDKVVAANQVSISNYKNNGSLFCRPLK